MWDIGGSRKAGKNNINAPLMVRFVTECPSCQPNSFLSQDLTLILSALNHHSTEEDQPEDTSTCRSSTSWAPSLPSLFCLNTICTIAVSTSQDILVLLYFLNYCHLYGCGSHWIKVKKLYHQTQTPISMIQVLSASAHSLLWHRRHILVTQHSPGLQASSWFPENCS
jgi:hypothetical protein